MGEDTWPFFGCCLYCVSADGHLVVNLSDWSIYFSEWFFTFSPTRSSSEHAFSFLSYDFPQFSHGIQDGISCNNTISPEYYTYKYTSTTLWEIHTFMVSIQGKTSWGEIKQNISKYLLFWKWDHMHVINSKCNPTSCLLSQLKLVHSRFLLESTWAMRIRKLLSMRANDSDSWEWLQLHALQTIDSDRFKAS